MLDIEKLGKIRKENYKTWFERWYKRNDVEREIQIANSRGFDELNLTLKSWIVNSRDFRMIKEGDFLEHIERKLPGFDVKRKLSDVSALFVKKEIITIRIYWGQD